MFGSWVLEVAIGLIFVFLLFGTICAALREGIEAWLKTRAAYLERGIRELLHDKTGQGLATQFYEHPLILSLYAASAYTPGATNDKPGILARGDHLPSYIPAKNFAAALIDLAVRGPVPVDGTASSTVPITADSLREGIGKMENKQVARVLLNALDLAANDLDKARLNLENWFDSGMDRVSGWYKRSTQWIIFVIAFIAAAVMNVDTIGIANFLYQNDTARMAIVVKAETDTNAPAAPSLTPQQKFEQASAALAGLALPVGQPVELVCRPREPGPACSGRRALIVLGWLLTAIAATLGAPFWFDTLNKVMVIRSTVKPYEKSKPEASEDRQPPG